MHKTASIRPSPMPPLAAALLALSLSGTVLANPLADWRFDEPAGTPLNLSSNSGSGVGGPGGTWDVAVPGLATTGAGTLRVANTGSGGSGTRTTYADLGPVATGSVNSGVLSAYLALDGWNLAGADGARLSLAMIEGNDFNVAAIELQATGSALLLGVGVDPFGDGSALPAVFGIGASSAAPLTVALSVDLGTRDYTLAYHLSADPNAAFVPLGSGSVDGLTLGINSLRLSFAGDFSAGGLADRGLSVERIWVLEGPITLVPEPGTWALWLGGLALLLMRRRARPPHLAQPA